jgi:hypothetical protein
VVNKNKGPEKCTQEFDDTEHTHGKQRR